MPMKPVLKESNQTLKMIDECVLAIRQKTDFTPKFCLVLGTGLGSLSDQVKTVEEFDYSDLPHFPQTTVESHQGKLRLGYLEEVPVVVMEGRFHYYEGYSLSDVVFPIRVAKFLGAENLIVSNAAGGINLDYKKGDIIAIEDHINLLGDNPLIGPNDERVGPRFPDMSEPYSKELLSKVMEAAESLKMNIRQGVYLAISGPNLETRAEYRMIKTLGADLVGMSTVPEVIAGVHLGMKILGLSVVTDVCDPEHLEPVSIPEIIAVANEAGPKLDQLIRETLKKIGNPS